jgi:hypothetical protein
MKLIPRGFDPYTFAPPNLTEETGYVLLSASALMTAVLRHAVGRLPHAINSSDIDNTTSTETNLH